MSDLVERLRLDKFAVSSLVMTVPAAVGSLCHEAATEIQSLREKVQDLRMYGEQDACEIERLRAVESLLIDQVTEAQMEAAHLRAENADLWEFIEDMPSGPESFNQFIHESQTGRIGGAE